MDAVVDGITCVQQRKEPDKGAQDLQTFSWISQSIGAITASIMGGLFV